MISSYRITLVTAPTSEPITLTEAKTHMRIDASDDDDYITALITAARIMAEEYTKRSFINTTWKMFLDAWPCCNRRDRYQESGFYEMAAISLYQPDPLTLPKGRLQSVTHIKTYDDTDAATTIAASNYYVGAYSNDSGQITLRSGGDIPLPARIRDGIEIQFVTGYGSSASAVPAAIKQAILMQVAGLYENRGDCQGGEITKPAMTLLSQYRIIQL